MLKRFLLPRLYQIARMYWRVRQPLSLGARVAIFRESEVYLVKLTYTKGWHFPGGGIHKGESLYECARREALEEASIEPLELELFQIYYNRNEYKHDHVAIFVCRKFREWDRQADRLEITEGRFFPLSALPEDTTPASRKRLLEICDRIRPARDW